MLYFWLMDLCATCAREERDFGPYNQSEDLVIAVGANMRSTLRILALLSDGYGLKASPCG